MVKIGEVKVGDVVITDAGFSCMRDKEEKIVCATDGKHKYILCDQGRHYLNAEEPGLTLKKRRLDLAEAGITKLDEEQNKKFEAERAKQVIMEAGTISPEAWEKINTAFEKEYPPKGLRPLTDEEWTTLEKSWEDKAGDPEKAQK